MVSEIHKDFKIDDNTTIRSIFEIIGYGLFPKDGKTLLLKRRYLIKKEVKPARIETIYELNKVLPKKYSEHLLEGD